MLHTVREELLQLCLALVGDMFRRGKSVFELPYNRVFEL